MDTLSNLLRQSSLDDHKQILKAADHTLKTDASNIEAQHAKVVALLKLDRYDDALQAFEDAGETLKDTARLEWAYTLYRTNRSEEAEQVAKSDNTKRSLKHVSAQVAYRAENFALAGKIYDVLTRQGAGHESSDLRINSSANDAQLAWTGQAHLARKTKRDREDMEHSETAFNVACGCISRGELKQAEMLLNMARGGCFKEQGCDPAGMLTTTQIYVMQTMSLTKRTDKLSFYRSLHSSSMWQ
jgi:signal recognition particle subunit SRP72